MRDLADLLVAVSTLVGSLAGAIVLVWTSVVQPRRDRAAAAKKAAAKATTRLLEALADGEITPEELDSIRKEIAADEEEGT